MLTVADIAAQAFTAVGQKISGVIKSCTLTRTVQGAYNPATGQHDTTTQTDTGRLLFDTSTAIEDALQGYVAGPGEELVWIEGLDALKPKENDRLTVGGETYTVRRVGDLVGAGSFYAATVVRGG